MNKIIMLLASMMMFITACDNKQSQTQKENNVVEKQIDQNVEVKDVVAYVGISISERDILISTT